MQRLHGFSLILNGILALFMSIMIYVTYLAYTRTSGSTGQDAVQIQKIRHNALLSKRVKSDTALNPNE